MAFSRMLFLATHLDQMKLSVVNPPPFLDNQPGLLGVQLNQGNQPPASHLQDNVRGVLEQRLPRKRPDVEDQPVRLPGSDKHRCFEPVGVRCPVGHGHVDRDQARRLVAVAERASYST